MGYAVVAAVVLFTLFGLSRWAEIMRRHRAEQDRIDRGLPVEATAAEAIVATKARSARVRRRAWFAVARGEVREVARTLALRTVQPVASGDLERAALAGLFVASAAGGRVIAAGIDAWARGDVVRIDEALRRLSQAHGEAAWFGIDEERDVCGWALARGGEVLRAFCWDGQDEEVLWEVGEPTPDETALGFFAADPRDGSDDAVKWWPLPKDVRALARRWSGDPGEGSGAPDSGALGGRW